ncbi:hypothetical protein JOB18_044574 [Solea senegalensis]|uniref:Uncharacterized protein n=1 Tax=Solea senegalensis TaxID=28829 RepID=A0AAV6PHV6_SOLSE|nr:hypothetical protein JOB18_044574 [Solea senegalensis]
MARGDFRYLSGARKLLNKFEHNPYADPMTHNLNCILIDNGYQPSCDIPEKSAQIRKRLLDENARLGDPVTPKEHSQRSERVKEQERKTKTNNTRLVYLCHTKLVK